MSWSRSSKEWRGIRQICRKKILDDVIKPLITENQWLVLVVDKFGMNLLSACFKTEEILSQNVALIEMFHDKREPLLYLSAMYLICPTEENINLLISDFEESLYGRNHLIFLSAVSEEIFETLALFIDPYKVMTFKELNIMFLPYESQVFSLDDELFFTQYFNAYEDVNIIYFKRMAKKLATLFVTLGEIPLIRYRRNFVKNLIFAEILQQEFNLLKEMFPHSRARHRSRCQLLILDRGFDSISPLLHEFTFQAMAYDLLEIKDNIYEYSLSQGISYSQIHCVPLTEDDQLWCQLRHEHIADVAKIIQNKIETDTLIEKTSFIRERGLPNLSDTIKRFILNKKHESFYSYRHMANECMKLYCAGINITSQLEQSLALGTTADGRPTRNPLGSVINILLEKEYDRNRKFRILLLYIFFMKGISKRAFDDIIKESNIPSSSAYIISNVLHLDIDIFRAGNCVPIQNSCMEKIEDSDPVYKQSRWKPLIKYIILNCINGTLSEDHFPCLDTFGSQELIPIQRTGYWCSDKKSGKIPKLIVFIAGGVTYSEMACTYEIMKKYSGWDIFIGGDSLLIPSKFIEKLAELPNLMSGEVLKI